MTFEEYSRDALATSICPENMDVIYPLIGLSGEAGEVAEKVKKVYRDNNGIFTDEIKHQIVKELGDCLWYINKMVADLGYSLEDAANTNLYKIIKRRAENTIHGEGDNR